MNRLPELIEFLEVMGLWFLAVAKWLLITGGVMLVIAAIFLGTVYVLKQLDIYKPIARAIRNFIVG